MNTEAGRAEVARTPGEASRYIAVKVPEVTALFWLTKALTTAMGESTSDYLVHRFAPGVAVAVGFVVFCVAMLIQFTVRRYYPWSYWFAVSMVGVFGTMAADVLHVGLGIPYAVSTVLFAATLALVFVTWQRVEQTLSIHSITTPRRELFYWSAVVTTFALGTAAGDLTATTLHLGYLTSALVFAAVILVPAAGYYRFGMNSVLAFWFAYVLTRPVGASIADWLGKSATDRGLGIGPGLVSLILTGLILCCVTYLAATKSDPAMRVSQVGLIATNDLRDSLLDT